MGPENKAIISDSLRRRFRDMLGRRGCYILGGDSGDDPAADFARSVAEGLDTVPRRLDCRFLYDAEGSTLFDLITVQPEYYLTRTEASIIAENAVRIREKAGPVSIVELGSGSASKTGLLLRAWLSRGDAVSYIPVDVSMTALENVCDNISGVTPGLSVTGVNTDYLSAFSLLRDMSPVMVVFLGSSIGNFAPRDMDFFFACLARALSPGDRFLIGIDLVKDSRLLDAAYNDAAGITANFTRNIFARMNRELGSDIDLSAVDHVARYNPEAEQVEISARFTREQLICVAPVNRAFAIDSGEMIQVEICRKFRMPVFLPYLEGFGFKTEETFTDTHNWFALVLLQRQETNG